MADFTRFMSYLYDYKQNTRSRNLGFAKVEVRQGMCRIGPYTPAELLVRGWNDL